MAIIMVKEFYIEDEDLLKQILLEDRSFNPWRQGRSGRARNAGHI